MKMMYLLLAIISALFLLIACGGDDGDVNLGVHEAPETCVPGATDPCFCADGAIGSQICDGTGKRYESCTCPDPQDPPLVDAGVDAPTEDVLIEAEPNLDAETDVIFDDAEPPEASIEAGQDAEADVIDMGIQPGDRVKGSLTTVFYIGDDWKRHVFPNSTTYFSWFKDWEGIKPVDDATLSQIAIGGNITIRPGTKLLKITTDPKVYAVTNCRKIHWLESEAILKALYGLHWMYRVVDVPDAFFVNYTIGASISTTVHPNGQLIYYAGSTNLYVVWNGQKRKIQDQVSFNSNRWNVDDAVQTTIQYPDGPPVTGPEPDKFWQIACPY